MPRSVRPLGYEKSLGRPLGMTVNEQSTPETYFKGSPRGKPKGGEGGDGRWINCCGTRIARHYAIDPIGKPKTAENGLKIPRGYSRAGSSLRPPAPVKSNT